MDVSVSPEDEAGTAARRADDIEAPRDLEALFKRLKSQCIEDLSKQKDWREEAREDYAFVSNDQWTEEDKAALRAQMRPIITMNRIEPIVDSVSGQEVGNRQEVRYIPRQQGAVKVNELLTSAAKWFRDQCDAEDEESDAFRDTIICGMGWTETRLDYEDDPDGVPLVDRADPLEMVWDSSARKRNLADMRRVFHIRRDIPIEEARALIPNDTFENSDYHASWVDISDTEGGEAQHVDGEFYDRDEASKRDDGGDGDKRVTLVRAQWWEREPAYRLASPANPQQIITVSAAEHEDLQARAAMVGVPLRSVRVTRKVYRQAYLGRELLEVGEAPCKEHFSFHCITGKRDRNKGQWYGLVRTMKDAQRWANKWLSQTQHIMNTTAKGGILAERGVFDNDADAEDSWAKQDAITWAKKGALTEGKLQPKPQTQFPAGFFQLTQLAISSIRDVSGVNVEILGMANTGSQAASLDLQRKQSAMTILQPLFDGLRRYRKMQGRMLLYLIQNYLSDGRLIRIVGDGEEQYVPLVRQEGVTTYDVIVDESPTSANQKEATWAMFQQILPVIGKMLPLQAWLALMKYSPLPTTAQADLEKAFATQQQQPDPETVKLQSEMKADEQRTATEVDRIKRRTDAEVEGMTRKAATDAEIRRNEAATKAIMESAVPQVGANGEMMPADPNMALAPLLIGLTQALQALSAPKEIIYDQSGAPIGIKAVGV